jgi:hypothetical protein
MKKLLHKLIIVLAVFNTGNIYGQELTWGKTLTSDTKVYMPNIFGEDKDFIYVISYERGDIAIEKFDKKTWEKSYSKVIEAKSEEYYAGEGFHDKSAKVLEQVTLLSGQFLVFSSDFNNETNVYSLYTSLYDAKTGEKTQENEKLCEVEVEKLRRRGKWGFVSSKNRNYILIHHFAYHKKKRMYETHNIIIDENLEILVDKKETESRDENTYKIYNYMVDNEGSFYYAKRYSAAETYVVSYDANKDYEKWEEKIDLENLKVNHRLSNITFGVNEKNDIIITGFYEFLNKRASKYQVSPGDLKGSFFMKIDGISKELVVNKISEFNEDFLKSFQSKKQKKKNEIPTVLNRYGFTQLLTKTDGGGIFIGEHQFSREVQNGVIFYYRDFVVINLSADGEIIWSRRMMKNQVYSVFILKSIDKAVVHAQYFSYVAGLGKEKLYVLYNDHEKNVGKPLHEPYDFIKFKEGVPVMAAIDLKGGDVEYSVIKELSGEKIHFMPLQYYQANQGTNMILFGQGKKNYKFGVLSF